MNGTEETSKPEAKIPPPRFSKHDKRKARTKVKFVGGRLDGQSHHLQRTPKRISVPDDDLTLEVNYVRKNTRAGVEYHFESESSLGEVSA